MGPLGYWPLLYSYLFSVKKHAGIKAMIVVKTKGLATHAFLKSLAYPSSLFEK